MQLLHRWLGNGVDFQEGLEIQQHMVQAILKNEVKDLLLSLEHNPVYTIGRTRDQSSLGTEANILPHPTVEINRGGQATYHGPGQLVGYPILDLKPLGRDLHAYIRAIEEALIRSCAEYGVTASTRDGLTGVWVENRKLASIGVGVRKWISMHGFAINLNKESLTGFLSITPCGLDGVTMTSLESECGSAISVQEFANYCAEHLSATLAELIL